jgi:hypothetical protein
MASDDDDDDIGDEAVSTPQVNFSEFPIISFSFF